MSTIHHCQVQNTLIVHKLQPLVPKIKNKKLSSLHGNLILYFKNNMCCSTCKSKQRQQKRKALCVMLKDNLYEAEAILNCNG